MREDIKIRLLQNILEEVTKQYDYFISQKDEIIKETFQKAIKDKLTGLYNREFLFEALNKLSEKTKRTGSKFVLIFFDLNNFKNINDNYGHEEGDRVLKKVANILKQSFRKYDIVVRYGGDEFIVIIELDKNINIEKTLKKLEEKIENSFAKYNISIAYGIANSDESDNIEKLIEIADMRMYQDKKTKKSKANSTNTNQN
ncbi:GGDEF domain-containing protein [Caminibacter profundus]